MSASLRVLDELSRNGAKIRVHGASGQLGYGIPTPAFNAAIERKPHLIGCDMGSIDIGPYYLGSGQLATDPSATRRDLRKTIQAARRLNIPLIIGSAGSAGAASHLDQTLALVRDIAREDGLHFRLGVLRADIPKDTLKRAIAAGDVNGLEGMPELDAAEVDAASNIVGQMGSSSFQRALAAGIDVRMITGDHTITARAIADELGLGPGVATGAELGAMSDQEVLDRLPELHVFGRVAPEDKVRLARLMQDAGEVVAMTGDAVNDAAALKQADVGVAMGSGSEVSKQAAKMVLTDDNFATLVHAVDLGRDIYRRITTYVKLQLTILSSVLQLMLIATIFDINEGVAMFPMMLLFCKLFVVVTVVIGIVVDVPDPGVMQRPPRAPGTRIVNRDQVIRWVVSGFVVAVAALCVLSFGPDEPSTELPSASMTMAFAVVALSSVNMGLVMRREREPVWSSPVFPYLGWILFGWTLTWAAVELGMLQRLLLSTPLTGNQWAVCIGLSAIAPLLVWADKQLQLWRSDRTSA